MTRTTDPLRSPTLRTLRITDIMAWRENGHESEMKAIAARLGMPLGRKWSEIPDEEVETLWFWCCRGDRRTDDQFDEQTPF